MSEDKVLETPTAADTPKPRASEDDITEAMKDVVDPELGINVVDLGLLYGNQVHEDNTVTLDMTLTSRGLPADRRHRGPDPQRPGAAGRRRPHQLGLDAAVGPDKITDDGRDQLRALGFNV
jgi:metal-sulfur cluster biosynthetic enzyme